MSVLYLYGPESMGGNGDLADKISRIRAEDPELREKEIENVRVAFLSTSFRSLIFILQSYSEELVVNL